MIEMDALVLYCPPMAAAPHTHTYTHTLGAAPLLSALPVPGQLALGTERMDWRTGRRTGPKEKGLPHRRTSSSR